jgi:hypothetical protein
MVYFFLKLEQIKFIFSKIELYTKIFNFFVLINIVLYLIMLSLDLYYSSRESNELIKLLLYKSLEVKH